MQTQLPQIYYIIFTAITAIGVLLQAFVLLGMYLAIRQTSRKMHEITEEMRGHLIPAIASTRRLIDDLSPKLKIASTNLVEASHTLRHETIHIKAAVDDVLDKTTAQAERVNEITSGILNSLEHATVALQHAASVPIRQISGIMAGLKAGFDVLRRKEKEPEPAAAEVPEEVIP
jgi:hypothetical protein